MFPVNIYEHFQKERSYMNQPDQIQTEKETTLPEWHEPFPEPQSFPSGWDLRDVLRTTQAASSDVDIVAPEM